MKQPSRKRASGSAPAPSSNGESRESRRASDDEIRARAYHIYLARGGAPGQEMDDWLQAERELTIEAVVADGPASAPPPARSPRTSRRARNARPAPQPSPVEERPTE